jgi:hypothetical protein
VGTSWYEQVQEFKSPIRVVAAVLLSRETQISMEKRGQEPNWQTGQIEGWRVGVHPVRVTCCPSAIMPANSAAVLEDIPCILHVCPASVWLVASRLSLQL